MAKLSKFFKSLLGFKTTASPPSRSDPNNQPKRQWNFVESNREHPRRLRSTSRSSDGANSGERRRLRSSSGSLDGRDGTEDPSKHAIALAAATAAVVDAAVVEDQAAAEVVRMTGGTTGYGGRRELAAVRIQSCFRAYLARKALRALKALVKLQALVRGHILRKQTVDMVRRLQALTRAQARVRVRQSDSTHLTNHGTPTPKKYEHVVGTKGTKNDHPTVAKRNGYISYTRGTTSQKKTFIDGLTNEENDKIVEIDHEKPYITVRKRNLFQTDHSQSQSLSTSRVSTAQPTSSSPCASCEVNSIEGSTRGGPPTPLKSNGSRSYVSEYFDKPNYMSYTMSSRAKVRSLSAPKPRPLNEHNGINKNLIYRQWSGMRSVSTMRDSFFSKGYQGSGRLDRLGMPVVGVSIEEIEFYGGYWN